MNLASLIIIQLNWINIYSNIGTSAFIGHIFGTPNDYSIPTLSTTAVRNLTCTTNSADQLRCFPIDVSSNCDNDGGYAIVTCAAAEISMI